MSSMARLTPGSQASSDGPDGQNRLSFGEHLLLRHLVVEYAIARVRALHMHEDRIAQDPSREFRPDRSSLLRPAPQPIPVRE